MTKQEWKMQHAANRRIFKGLFCNMRDGEKSPTKSKSFNIAARSFWEMLKHMHPSFEYAMQPNRNTSYPLKHDRWAARHNTTCFNENKRLN